MVRTTTDTLTFVVPHYSDTNGASEGQGHTLALGAKEDRESNLFSKRGVIIQLDIRPTNRHF